MGFIYDEKVEKSKLTFLILTAISILATIMISAMGRSLMISSRTQVALDFVLTVGLLFLTWRMIIRSRTCTKYSIIADALYIHNVCSGGPKLIREIKLSNIISIEAADSLLDKIIGLKSGSVCLYKKLYEVKFEENGKTERLYMVPSDRMVLKLASALK